MSTYRPASSHYLHTSKVLELVSFLIFMYIDLFNASRSANNNTAMIVGVLSGGIAIGVVAVLLVQGIVCGVCKLKNWKKHPTSSTETDPIDENKSVTYYKTLCILNALSTDFVQCLCS